MDCNLINIQLNDDRALVGRLQFAHLLKRGIEDFKVQFDHCNWALVYMYMDIDTSFCQLGAISESLNNFMQSVKLLCIHTDMNTINSSSNTYDVKTYVNLSNIYIYTRVLYVQYNQYVDHQFMFQINPYKLNIKIKQYEPIFIENQNFLRFSKHCPLEVCP